MIQPIQAILRTSLIGDLVPQAQTVEVPHGETVQLEVDVLVDDGTEPDLTAATLTMRILSVQGLLKLHQTVVAGGTRRGRFTALVTTGTKLSAGTYAWDLWLQQGSSHRQILPLSSWVILPTSV